MELVLLWDAGAGGRRVDSAPPAPKEQGAKVPPWMLSTDGICLTCSS